jgi:hypothetical protein
MMRSASPLHAALAALASCGFDFPAPRPRFRPRPPVEFRKGVVKRRKPARPIEPDAAYLGACCNYALNAYGRAMAGRERAQRIPPAEFFGGPPPRTKWGTQAALGGARG